MKVSHSKIGTCTFVLQFEGNKNQLVLVKSHKTQTAEGIKDGRFGTKPKYWLLWGPLGMKIEDLGATCWMNANGTTYSETRAIKTFMETSKYVDTLTMNRKHA